MRRRLTITVHRILRQLLPRRLRRLRGDEMEQTFLVVLEQARARRGWRGAAAVWCREVTDLVRTAIDSRRTRAAPVPMTRRSSPRNGTGTVRAVKPTPSLLRGLGQDLRISVRALLKAPGFTGTAIVTLALGIGLNTAIFSVANGVLLQPLPYPEAGQLAVVQPGDRERGTFGVGGLSLPNFEDVRAATRSFTDLAAVGSDEGRLTGAGDPIAIEPEVVTPNLFDILGVSALHGRVFTEAESVAGERVAVLGHALWRSRFSGDPAVVGRTIRLNDETFTVVGVMPPWFKASTERYGRSTALWVPVTQQQEWLREHRGIGAFTVLGRLREGVGLEQATQELEMIASRLRQEHPDVNESLLLRAEPLQRYLAGDYASTLWLLYGAVGFVLLIACANVANLLLARATSRRQESAIRLSLGAGSWRVVRQLLVESVLLALTGGALGVLLAHWSVQLFLAFAPDQVPGAEAIGIHPVVLAYAAVMAGGVAFLFGLLPAIRSSRVSLSAALERGGSRSRDPATGRRARNALVITEVALTMTLMAGAGLLIHDFSRLVSQDPGFRAENVLTAMVSLPEERYPERREQWSAFESMLAELSEIPGVTSAAATAMLPFAGGDYSAYIELGSRSVPVSFRPVTPDYFETMGMRLLRGQGIPESGGGVAVVNESLARLGWPDQDPLGKQLRLLDLPALRVVGVVNDVPLSFNEPPAPRLYFSFRDRPVSFAAFVLKVPSGRFPEVASAVEAAVWRTDPALPVQRIQPLTDYIAGSVRRERFYAATAGLLAIVAIALAVVGVVGVLSYSVSQRTYELGVRKALGADARNLAGLVLHEGFRLVATGWVAGLAGGIVMSRYLASRLSVISPTELTTFAVVSVLLLGIALLASTLPARRAMAADPLTALRSE